MSSEEISDRVIQEINRHYEVDQDFLEVVRQRIVNELNRETPVETAKPVAEKKKRAPTAYNIFMREKSCEFKDMSNGERMKKIGEAWKSLSAEEQEEYAKHARAAQNIS